MGKERHAVSDNAVSECYSKPSQGSCFAVPTLPGKKAEFW